MAGDGIGRWGGRSVAGDGIGRWGGGVWQVMG